MFVWNQISHSIASSMKLIEKFNIFPFACPFRVELVKGTRHKFVVNTHFQHVTWKVSIVTISSVILLAAYRSIFEENSLLGTTTELWKLILFSLFLSCSSFYKRNSLLVAHFFNQIGNFEQSHSTVLQAQSVIDEIPLKMVSTFLRGFPIFVLGNCLLFGVTGWLVPNAPWNFIPFPISSENDLQFPVKTAIAVHTYVGWRVGGNIANINVAFCLLASCFSLNSNLIAFRRILRLSSLNTDFSKLCQIYREIQILVDIYNNVFKQPIILGYVTVAPISLSVCSYLVISQWYTLDTSTFLVFVSLGMLSISIITLVFQYAVDIFSTSESLVACRCWGINSRRDGNFQGYRRSSRLAKMYLKSMPKVKIRFLSSNFFESQTPLVILDFSISLAINLVLLDAQKSRQVKNHCACC